MAYILIFKKPIRYREVYVYLAGDDEMLKDIQTVYYDLHSGTFDNWAITGGNRESNYGIKLVIWGEFQVQATVVSKTDPKKTLVLSGYLKLFEDEDIVKEVKVDRNRSFPIHIRTGRKGSVN